MKKPPLQRGAWAARPCLQFMVGRCGPQRRFLEERFTAKAPRSQRNAEEMGLQIADCGSKKPLLQGERWRPAGRVTHLAGHLFNRGGAFQAPCPFSLFVKWQDKIETPRRGERRGLRRGEELLVICDWLLGKRIKKRPHQVAGASCSRPSMERPAPCSAPPVPRCFFPSSLETTHLNLETAYFSCFKSTRKCGLGRDRNFFLEIFCLCQHLSHPSC